VQCAAMATGGMESPVADKPLTAGGVVDLTVEQLKQELEKLGQETKGASKTQMQKALTKLLSPSKSQRRSGE